MAKVATFSPESPHDPAHTAILHSTEDERNVSQIGMLLQIREQASNLLIQQEQIGTTWNIDKEAQDDARETFTLAGIQLRNLIDEQRRWTLDQNEIDRKTIEVLDLKIKEHENRIVTQNVIKTPSAMYRTQLRKIELRPGHLTWVCWLGGNEPAMNDCHGLGITPEEAMKAFDTAFVQAVQNAPPAVVQPQPAPASEKKPTKKGKK